MYNTKGLEKTIEKIGAELGTDILEWMLSDSDTNREYGREDLGKWKNWELLSNPVDNMLEWQAMRDRKNGTITLKQMRDL